MSENLQKEITPRVGQIVFDYKKFPGRTKQSERDACDINKIMARIIKTGVDPFADRAALLKYVDCSEIGSFQDMQDYIIKVSDFFETLPALIREKFDNNPAEFSKFAIDETNIDSLEKMGILKKQPMPSSAAEVGPTTPGGSGADGEQPKEVSAS